jgi:hypothetical protein
MSVQKITHNWNYYFDTFALNLEMIDRIRMYNFHTLDRQLQ